MPFRFAHLVTCCLGPTHTCWAALCVVGLGVSGLVMSSLCDKGNISFVGASGDSGRHAVALAFIVSLTITWLLKSL